MKWGGADCIGSHMIAAEHSGLIARRASMLEGRRCMPHHTTHTAAQAGRGWLPSSMAARNRCCTPPVQKLRTSATESQHDPLLEHRGLNQVHAKISHANKTVSANETSCQRTPNVDDGANKENQGAIQTIRYFDIVAKNLDLGSVARIQPDLMFGISSVVDDSSGVA
jgi:hypothetical protein